jgi:tetrahydromethanopterin S-methyltransferase subunit B
VAAFALCHLFPDLPVHLVVMEPYASLVTQWKEGDFFYSLRCIFEKIETLGNVFFLISKNSLKSAEGRNPSTQRVYKGAPN